MQKCSSVIGLYRSIPAALLVLFAMADCVPIVPHARQVMQRQHKMSLRVPHLCCMLMCLCLSELYWQNICTASALLTLIMRQDVVVNSLLN